MKMFKATAYVAELFNHKTGELKQKKDRNYFYKKFQACAESKSDAMIKIGRQISANELTHEGIEIN